ncbi:MFS transporter [Salinisphaera sp.]|uniref:MFS transporter n=1 Tax=Salinisphaera sp. TaxID=1914330 RepID=UPI002D7A2EB7|nr:MFS transporter [Salinisphaera sp.]HET7313388.1 MFS transporter [Salinisphaera sp.]
MDVVGSTRLAQWIGGRQRLQVIVLLASVLALDGADKATVGAIAAPLKSALHIGNIQIGLLVTASTAVGAVTTLPLGALVDRAHRVRLLTVAMLLWSAAMVASGFAESYTMLLVTRLLLGGVVAAAAPAISSLTGDFFPAFERGRIWGYLLAGELVGSALGLAMSGTIAGWLSWRAAFWLMGALGFVLAVLFGRCLAEPERGGMARLTPDESVAGAHDGVSIIEAVDQAGHIQPSPAARRQPDPGRLSFGPALRYILSIRTNVILILASALGYFFFTGLRSFGVVLMSGKFGFEQSAASLITVGLGMGSIIGTLIAGRLADRLIANGYLSARILVPAVAFLLCAAFLIPGVLATSLWITGPVFFISAASLGATNPALDAARLDIMHSQVWGRGESVRTALRYVFEAIAPLAFGYLSTLLGDASGSPAARHTAQQGVGGLVWTFVAMSGALVMAGVILFFARRSYPRDVANALAAERASESDRRAPGEAGVASAGTSPRP